MKPTFRRRLWCVVWCIAASSLGCARASKEPEKAVTAAPATPVPLAATSSGAGEQERTEVRAEPTDEAADTSPHVAPAAAAAAATKEGPLPVTQRKQSLPQPAAARPRGAASTPPHSERASDTKAAPPSYALTPERTPAFAEPPELHAALVEFDAQFERLSNSRACDDACRAFESMRRSAQRICDLVVASDPRQRCRTARARLDQAARDLAARCTDCQ